MKIAFKNFVMTLRRYKMASVLNIAGLTLAFTAFYIIMAQVHYEMSFNRPIADNERVYMLRPLWEADSYSDNAPRPLSEQTMAASPDVEAGGVMKHYPIYNRLWIKRSDYNFEKFDLDTYIMSASMVDVMSFRTVAGNLYDVGRPGAAIVSRKTAELLGVGVGDDIYIPNSDYWSSDPRPDVRVTVAGVFEDFAENTLLRGKTIFVVAKDEYADTHNNNWNYSIYVKLREGADPAAFAQLWEDNYMDYARERSREYGDGGDEEEDRMVLKLQSLREQYYSSIRNSMWTGVEQGSASATATLLGIAVLIVVIAFINFVNFFFALIPVRLRAVNVCKVFGASTASLRWNFVFEAVGLVVCSLVLAMYLIVVVQDTSLTEYVKCSLSPIDNLPTVGLVLAVVSAMAVAAALYPAWYITSFNASLAAKGGFAGSAAGRRLRTVLVGVQFAVSMILIVLAFSFWLQYRFMINYDLGFDRENILTFRISGTIAKKSEAFRAHLAGNPDIEAVTAAGMSIPGLASQWGRTYKDRQIKIYAWTVAPDFFEVMGIPILEGDGFTASSYERSDMMIGRYFHRDTGVEVGGDMAGNTVVGVFKDIQLLSVAENDRDVYIGMTCGRPEWMCVIYMRTRAGADIPRVCDFVRKAVAEFDPNADEPSVEFLDQGVQRLYGSTKVQMVVISLFALLAVVISLMGVFGMVLFDTQHRRREIAVRKVFGASTSGIVHMLNRRYVIIVTVCFVVAGPVAWYLAKRWLAGFATRIELSWWIFAVSFLAVFLITVGLVTLRSSRAANENPSRVLGGE